MNLKLIVICMFFSVNSFGQAVTKKPNGEALTKIQKIELEDKLDSLVKSAGENIYVEIEELNKKVSSYIKYREQECRGIYSLIEINEQGESDVVKRKLTKDEIKLCLIELVNFRKRVTDGFFKIRKENLKKLHTDQHTNLEKIRTNSIKKLDQMVLKLSK